MASDRGAVPIMLIYGRQEEMRWIGIQGKKIGVAYGQITTKANINPVLSQLMAPSLTPKY